MLIAAAFVMAALLSVLLTRGWLHLAARAGLLDPPNPIVPQHTRATVSMGGVPVAITALAAMAVIALIIRSTGGDAAPAAANAGATITTAGTAAAATTEATAAAMHAVAEAATAGAPAAADASGMADTRAAIVAILPAAIGFLLLGALDDWRRLSASAKLAGQAALAALAIAFGLGYPFSDFAALNALLNGLIIVTAVNAVNLTDVCDGLVSGTAAIALLAAALIWPAIAWCAAPAAGACAGFLRFNAPPARIFLGDAGSHWIGFLLAALPLAAPPRRAAPALHAAQAALLLGPFLFELALLIVARTRRGLPIWRGSPDHFSLRLQAAGLSRRRVVAIAWCAAAGLGLVALLLPAATPALRIVCLGAIGVAAAVLFARLLALPAA